MWQRLSNVQTRFKTSLEVDPGDIHVLGYIWDNKLYFDTALPMGLKSAPLICKRVTNFIRHILEDKGVCTVNNLDDFGGGGGGGGGGGAAVWEQAERNYSLLGEVLTQAGLGDAVEKRCPPTKQLLFWGIWFDSDKLTVSIDNDRLEELWQLLDGWFARDKCSRKQLESLLGKLKFAASCVRPGRVFTMRLLSDLRNAPKTGQFPITSEAKADLSWWRRFLAIYNRISMMPEEEWSGPGAIFTTDACLEGCGGGFKAGFSCPIPQVSPTTSAAHKCPWAVNHLGRPASVLPRADEENNCSVMW